jgi:hypothetical protein
VTLLHAQIAVARRKTALISTSMRIALSPAHRGHPCNATFRLRRPRSRSWILSTTDRHTGARPPTPCQTPSLDGRGWRADFRGRSVPSLRLACLHQRRTMQPVIQSNHCDCPNRPLAGLQVHEQVPCDIPLCKPSASTTASYATCPPISRLDRSGGRCTGRCTRGWGPRRWPRRA